MANINRYRTSKWLRKQNVAALPPDERRTAIDRIVEEEVGDDLKPVCHFEGIEKGWPINMTGLEFLAEVTGSHETDDYARVPVEIWVDPNVRYQGKRTGGIKLRTPSEPADTLADVGF